MPRIKGKTTRDPDYPNLDAPSSQSDSPSSRTASSPKDPLSTTTAISSQLLSDSSQVKDLTESFPKFDRSKSLNNTPKNQSSKIHVAKKSKSTIVNTRSRSRSFRSSGKTSFRNQKFSSSNNQDPPSQISQPSSPEPFYRQNDNQAQDTESVHSVAEENDQNDEIIPSTFPESTTPLPVNLEYSSSSSNNSSQSSNLEPDLVNDISKSSEEENSQNPEWSSEEGSEDHPIFLEFSEKQINFLALAMHSVVERLCILKADLEATHGGSWYKNLNDFKLDCLLQTFHGIRRSLIKDNFFFDEKSKVYPVLKNSKFPPKPYTDNDVNYVSNSESENQTQESIDKSAVFRKINIFCLFGLLLIPKDFLLNAHGLYQGLNDPSLHLENETDWEYAGLSIAMSNNLEYLLYDGTTEALGIFTSVLTRVALTRCKNFNGKDFKRWVNSSFLEGKYMLKSFFITLKHGYPTFSNVKDDSSLDRLFEFVSRPGNSSISDLPEDHPFSEFDLELASGFKTSFSILLNRYNNLVNSTLEKALAIFTREALQELVASFVDLNIFDSFVKNSDPIWAEIDIFQKLRSLTKEDDSSTQTKQNMINANQEVPVDLMIPIIKKYLTNTESLFLLHHDVERVGVPEPSNGTGLLSDDQNNHLPHISNQLAPSDIDQSQPSSSYSNSSSHPSPAKSSTSPKQKNSNNSSQQDNKNTSKRKRPSSKPNETEEHSEFEAEMESSDSEFDIQDADIDDERVGRKSKDLTQKRKGRRTGPKSSSVFAIDENRTSELRSLQISMHQTVPREKGGYVVNSGETLIGPTKAGRILRPDAQEGNSVLSGERSEKRRVSLVSKLLSKSVDKNGQTVSDIRGIPENQQNATVNNNEDPAKDFVDGLISEISGNGSGNSSLRESAQLNEDSSAEVEEGSGQGSETTGTRSYTFKVPRLPDSQARFDAIMRSQNRFVEMKRGRGNTAGQPKTKSGKNIWTEEEIDCLDRCINYFHEGCWARMLTYHGKHGLVTDILRNRTQTQLKDKVRNISKLLSREGIELGPYARFV
ncbi:hypothetical protein BB560_003800 [Smittium megazygosporum]|uniref:Myb-like domain-containing protein n=1 Tax=Smittium megazygosporum TaxID=133381 RepID=A0A2T9ZB09_9FUNG|nr:hypothetical protein BB560_003800 [Smittium megazygosporum]